MLSTPTNLDLDLDSDLDLDINFPLKFPHHRRGWRNPGDTESDPCIIIIFLAFICISRDWTAIVPKANNHMKTQMNLKDFQNL